MDTHLRDISFEADIRKFHLGSYVDGEVAILMHTHVHILSILSFNSHFPGKVNHLPGLHYLSPLALNLCIFNLVTDHNFSYPL